MKTMLQILAFFFSTAVVCQTLPGKITGSCKSEHNKALEFANIVLYRFVDSAFAKGGISDDKGIFEISDLAEGIYFFKISALGFENYSSREFTISNENPAVDFPDLVLKQATGSLSEVTITAEKQFIERKSDKLIVNVENSIVSAGNTVFEVLQRSPGIVVTDESISMRGKSGVVVMIDGKPSPLAGAELLSYLKSVPASNVQAIELISNPSARYDAAGNAGIINILFKKDKRQGVNGSATASYGQGVYPKPSASINFNARDKKVNVFGSYAYSRPQNFTYFYIKRKFFDQNQTLNSTFEQTSYTKQPSGSHNARIGADLYTGSRTVAGVMLNGNWSEGQRDGRTHATVKDNQGALSYLTNTGILLDEQRFNGFANFNLKHGFDSTGKELTADIDLGAFNSNTAQQIQNVNVSPTGVILSDDWLATQQRGNIAVKSIKADYVHPLGEKLKIETGLKSSLVGSDNDVKFFNVANETQILDSARSNHFIYDENINAVYTSLFKEFIKWDLQLGLRMEHTNTKGRQLSTDETFKRNYISLFPNISVNRKFGEDNALSFSYARRIDRPSYRQLNPFKIFVDSYTYVVGDPALRPVMTNIFELNHTLRGKYITTLSYTRSKQSITDVFVQDDITKISYQVPANIQDYEQYNLGVFIPFKIQKILNSTFSGSVYRNLYASPLQGGNLQQSFNSWDMNLNNMFTLGSKGWSAELSAYYQSKMVWGLFYIKSLAQVTAGIQKVSANKNAVFKFTVSDLFLTNHIAVIVQYQNQDFVTERNWDSRVVTLTYTQRFGKNTVARSRQRSSGVEDEKRRAS